MNSDPASTPEPTPRPGEDPRPGTDGVLPTKSRIGDGAQPPPPHGPPGSRASPAPPVSAGAEDRTIEELPAEVLAQWRAAPDEPAPPAADGSAPGAGRPAPPAAPLRAQSPDRPDPTGRDLILLWCLWLLGSWGVTLWLDSTVPAVRWMVYAAVLGMMVLWPVLRLSQEFRISDFRSQISDRNHPVGGQTVSAPPMAPDPSANLKSEICNPPSPFSPLRVLRDWVGLNLVFQAVIWPLRLAAQWSWAQAFWLDGAIAAWSLLTGLAIAWGCRSQRGRRRTLAMAACLLLVVGEPVVLVLWNLGALWGRGASWAALWDPIRATVTHTLTVSGGGGAAGGIPGGGGWVFRVSPLQALWALTDDPAQWTGRWWPAQIAAVALAALLGWAGAAARWGVERRA